MPILDITRPLYNSMPTWPGDTVYNFQLTTTIKDNDVVNVGRLTASTHTGTHVDAPFHYDDYAETIDKLPPELFIGKALVCHLPGRNLITGADFTGIDLTGVDRLLIRTDSWTDEANFPSLFTAICPTLGPVLGNLGVKLLGVDVPSVDPVTSKTLDAHHAFHRANICILESLLLTGVDPGIYELVALPLKIVGGDGSLVRAVLRRLE